MLEFYWAYVDYQRLMSFTEELLSTVAQQVIGTTEFPFGEHTINMSAPFRRLSLRHAAAEAASKRLGVTVTVEELRNARQRHRDRAEARRRDSEGRRRRQGRQRDLRGALGRAPDPADVRLRLPDRGVAAVEAARRRSRHGRAVRALHRRLRSGQRVQRAQRSGRAAAPLRGPAGQPRRRRSGSARHGRGLRARARVRHAAGRRRRHRHRSAGDAAVQLAVDSRRDPVPADAPAGRPGASAMPFELQVALRYLLAKRRQVFISVISLVSTLGVTVGVMALVISLALMTGLQGELQDRILGSSAHVFVYKPTGIDDYRAEVAKIRAVARRDRRGAGGDGQGDDQRHQTDGFLAVKGIDPELEPSVTDIGQRDDRRIVGQADAGHRGRPAGHRARQGSRRRRSARWSATP